MVLSCNKKTLEVLLIYGEEALPEDEKLMVIKSRQEVLDALVKKGFKVKTLAITKENLKDTSVLKDKIIRESSDVIFNLCEGVGEDPYSEVEVVKILEEIKIPFTGNNSKTLANCLDKQNAKTILGKENINISKGVIIKALEELTKLEPNLLKFPLIVKPCFHDASFGVDRFSYVTSHEELEEAIKVKLKKFPYGLVVEEFIKGLEYAIGLIGNNPYEVLAVSAIDYSKYPEFLPFLTYGAKWVKSAPEYKKIIPEINPKYLKDEVRNEIITTAFKIGELFSCRGYFRVDIREDERGLFVLDINPNPDISKDAGFARMAYVKGYDYYSLIEKIVYLALGNNYV